MLLGSISFRAKRERAKQTMSNIHNSAPAVAFRSWRKKRPFVGGLLIALSGLEMFFSSQLDIGKIHVAVGIAGLQSTVIPIALVALGVLIIVTPVHRIFYGIIAMAIAVYSLIGLNLGGFIIGLLLGAIGGILAVSWMPKTENAESTEPTKGAGTAVPLVQGR